MSRSFMCPIVSLLFIGALVNGGCALRKRAAPPPPPEPRAAGASPRESVLEQRVAVLELRLLEKEGQVEELQMLVDAARLEVVRAMAKLQTLATRAEAASGIAEAEIALQGLRNRTGSGAAAEVNQVGQLIGMSTAEFDRRNYGGALYLANQAKNLAGTRRARIGGERETLRAGETPFAVALPLQATAQSNVREGPGMNFRVVFTLDKGTRVVAHSLAGEWVRVTDDGGRSGWVFLTLVARR